MIMEYLAQRIKQQAAQSSHLPVELTAVEVGPNSRGREMISIDISEYGDPLSVRVIRVPFSLYLKPLQQRYALGDENVKRLPPLFLIPLNEMEFPQGIQIARDAQQVVELARHTTTKIPDQTQSTEDLIRSYEESSLKTFHDWFYSKDHDSPDMWPKTYDRTPFDMLPPCVRCILEYPNDLLLRPANVERVVRVLLALGWHPRHVAGLIRSKFERDYGWGEQWHGYDPAGRADFYTRVFAGLFATGVDNLVDLNCQSAKEEKLCFSENCRDNLERFKKSLLYRRKYERLARRPFNRLFLPNKHL